MLDRLTSHAFPCVMHPFETKFALTLVSAMPIPRGDGMAAVGVSVSLVSVCRLDVHVGFIGLHRTTRLERSICLHVCMFPQHPPPCTTINFCGGMGLVEGQEGFAWKNRMDEPRFAHYAAAAIYASHCRQQGVDLLYDEHNSESKFRENTYRSYRLRINSLLDIIN